MSHSTAARVRRASVALTAGLSAAALAACGAGSAAPVGAAGSANADERDAARVKLTQCLRDNGVDVPDGGGPAAGAGGRLSEADREKRREAIQGPCKALRDAAFGEISEEDRQERQDAFATFAQCMRDNGVDVPDLAGGDGPGGGGALRRLDPDDPDVEAAREACQDKLPQRPGGRGPGPGPGPGQ